MMRKQLFLFVLLSLAPLLLCSTAVVFSQQRWTKTYGGPKDDEGAEVHQTSDGGYIIVGITLSYGAGSYDVYLIKTNASGDTLWTRTYGGTGLDYGNSCEQTSDGGYIITGLTRSFGHANGYNDVYLIKTNASGVPLWTRTYGGTNDDEGYQVQLTSDGGYIIVGSTYSYGAGSYDVYLIKTNASGDTLWTRTYGGTDMDEGYSVQQTSDGGYIIAGVISLNTSAQRVYLMKTNASGGTTWTKTYGGTKSIGFYVQQTSDGGYIVTGGVDSGFVTNTYLIKTNASGDTLWSKVYLADSLNCGNAVQQTSDGGYIIAGWTESHGPWDVYLIKTNASGNTLWTRTYGGPEIDEAWSVHQTSDGGYIIAGYANWIPNNNNTGDVYLIKTDGNGNVGVEDKPSSHLTPHALRLTVSPNPFVSFTTVPSHEGERFSLYDISGRQVGTYKGDRIGEGLGSGVYFLRLLVGNSKPVRIVKVR